MVDRVIMTVMLNLTNNSFEQVKGGKYDQADLENSCKTLCFAKTKTVSLIWSFCGKTNRDKTCDRSENIEGRMGQ